MEVKVSDIFSIALIVFLRPTAIKGVLFKTGSLTKASHKSDNEFNKVLNCLIKLSPIIKDSFASIPPNLTPLVDKFIFPLELKPISSIADNEIIFLDDNKILSVVEFNNNLHEFNKSLFIFSTKGNHPLSEALAG